MTNSILHLLNHFLPIDQLFSSPLDHKDSVALTNEQQQQQEQQPGSTLLYWTLVPSLLTLTSMFISLLAQLFSSFWPRIEYAPHVQNKPTKSLWLSFVLNHSMASVLTSGCIAWSRSHGSLYEFNLFEMHSNWDRVWYVGKVLMCVLFMLILYDLCVYVFHRSCHAFKFMYRFFHQQHHENCAPRGVLDAIYGDSLESLIVALCASGQMMLFEFPISSVVIFLFLISFLVQVNHSGHCVEIPFLYNYRFHTSHHLHFRVNFSEHIMLWDYLFGTLKLSDPNTMQNGSKSVLNLHNERTIEVKRCKDK
ncbi:hypothetical protein FDP41_009225 [Naegleria fowleri]|uniref:Fatty acid hydroxylase domain-containing protein n=1 Tax=Naegleria fowleri TaxID=5763 RepID=A0A6A5BBI7_NAEFO|nr:uncharacterized protein FDP41_009225 [Naegleria fowleri]KAF0972322.1 hypothetical protein FDP41_009225 [Naegleria fowleri]